MRPGHQLKRHWELGGPHMVPFSKTILGMNAVKPFVPLSQRFVSTKPRRGKRTATEVPTALVRFAALSISFAASRATLNDRRRS